ncbi:MAG TPA: family 2A encapsulin nanocompartment cargo protein cysteine desulfurase, partial [Kofleriaceae bacterium]|nr:family 2A encapsulin nanocompartment cargo protein cysteine desulfurase [Kofleriaceae bacterium]
PPGPAGGGPASTSTAAGTSARPGSYAPAPPAASSTGAPASSPAASPAAVAPVVPTSSSAGASPFSAPLALGGLELLSMPTGFDVPLLDLASAAAGDPPLHAPSAQSSTAPGASDVTADRLPWSDPAPAPRTTISGGSHELVPTARPALGPVSGGPLDPHLLRREFPILGERVHGKRLVWLDNAATTQKPQAVIDRLAYYYQHENSNIHRAAHTLAARATDAYEAARDTVARFIGARSSREIVFVRGTTEGINLVAQSWGRANVGEGDEILISWLEHHANIVPWQQLCAATGARLRVAPVDDTGQIIVEQYARLLTPGKTKLVAFSQVSNALGTITPSGEMIALAHRAGARVLLDGAQSVSHLRTDVVALDCDFFVFSGHKVFAPTGIGAVYGKRDLLEATPPWQGGGNMISDVTFEHTTFQGPPARFEAGTGNIADAVGLGAALDWLARIGVEVVGAYEHGLLEYATEQLRHVPGLRMIGTAPEKAGVLSFVLAGQRTEEVGHRLDEHGIAVRSGHHCAQPILRRFGVEATVRASLAPYNTTDDIDCLVRALHELQATRGHGAGADRRAPSGPPSSPFDDPSP